MPVRKFITVFTLILMLTAFSLTVYAHPGSTDSHGGHVNHNTGEYHFHHGYPEHDHKDLDGDGDSDCPYNFQDSTGSSSSKAGVSHSVNSSSAKYQSKYYSDYFMEQDKKKNISSICSSILDFIFAVTVSIGPLLIYFHFRMNSEAKEEAEFKRNNAK